MSFKNDQVSEGETREILRWAERCLELEGDFVEMGCYKGDTSLLLAEILRGYNRGFACGKPVEEPVEKLGKNSENHVEKEARNGRNVVMGEPSKNCVKKLWIYDSFEGLPEKDVQDESALGVDFRRGELAVTKREVKQRFLRAGLPVPVIKKAWFSELRTEDMPGEIAFAFLDGDLYQSIRDSLMLVGLRMVSGGVIMVHDYNNPALPGVKRAVDEWMRGEKYRRTKEFGSILLICL